MATKKKRKKARSKKANPTKRKRKRVASKATAAPRRRARAANPAPKRSSGKRRASRRNPGGPLMQVAIAALAGTAAFVAVQTANMAFNRDFQPMIRRGIAAAGVAGGLLLAKKQPMIGAGIAAGSAVVLAGVEATVVISRLLPSPQPTTAAGLGAVTANMGAIESRMGSAYTMAPGDESMGYILGPGDESIGSIAPAAPWAYASPI